LYLHAHQVVPLFKNIKSKQGERIYDSRCLWRYGNNRVLKWEMMVFIFSISISDLFGDKKKLFYFFYCNKKSVIFCFF
jgi:hypothetical protein